MEPQTGQTDTVNFELALKGLNMSRYYMLIQIYWIYNIAIFYFQANIIGKTVEEDRDVITGLLQKTKFGRPNWDLEFGKIAQAHPELVHLL